MSGNLLQDQLEDLGLSTVAELVASLTRQSPKLGETSNFRALAASLGCPCVEGDEASVLSFLAAELQLRRLTDARGNGGHTESGLSMEVINQLHSLVGSSSEASTLPEVLATLEQRVVEVDDAVSWSPPSEARIAPSTPSAITDLQNVDRVRFEKFRDSLQMDFTLRRRMLLARLDVTIQSFLWGNQAMGREEEITASVAPLRESLTEEARKFTLKDVIAAKADLARALAAKRAPRIEERDCIAKQVVIADVPDRGGRANETRPSAADLNPYGRPGRGNFNKVC